MYPDAPDPSHIDTLPNELLAEIFKLDRTCYRFGDNTHLPNEIVYSHVSRRWRNVAVNLPTLWTRIYVVVHSSLLWLPHYLSRSQRCHLDVWIDHCGLDTCCGEEDPENKIADIMSLLIPHANRWSHLRVEGLQEYSTYLVLSHLEDISTPVLREFEAKFEVDVWEEWLEEYSIPFNILQGGAPLLTSIRMDMLQRCWPPLSVLTACTIYQSHRSTACTRFIQMLASSHALTKLRVYSDEFSEFDSSSRIQLDALKSLWLNTLLRHDILSPLLSAISAPRLETLKLEGIIDSTIDTLFDSPQRSLVEFPTLHTLSLDSIHLRDRSYIQLSCMFPSITHLEVRGVFPSNFRKLAHLIGAPKHLYETEAMDTGDGRRMTDIIWPKLHTIMVGNLTIEPFSPSEEIDNALHNLLAARKALGRPIERLVLEDNVLGMNLKGTDGLREYLELRQYPYHDEFMNAGPSRTRRLFFPGGGINGRTLLPVGDFPRWCAIINFHPAEHTPALLATARPQSTDLRLMARSHAWNSFKNWPRRTHSQGSMCTGMSRLGARNYGSSARRSWIF